MVTTKVKTLITICARGGSKGIKGKNIRPLLGKPLIDYTLKSACLFRDEYADTISTDIVVDSDSTEILERAGHFEGIMQVKRPVNLAQDNTPKVPVIQNTTLQCECKTGNIYDFVIDLDVTSPLRHNRDIYSVLTKCAGNDGYDLVFSAVPARRNPYFNMVELRDGYAYKIRESAYASRQEAPDVYDMNPSIYCYKRDALINKLKRITFEGNSGLYEMPETYVIDLDHESDFIIMEKLIEHHYREIYRHLF